MLRALPSLAVGLMVFLTYTNASMVVSGSLGFFHLTEALYVLALAVAAYDFSGRRELPENLPIVTLAILVYLASLAVTAFGATDPSLVIAETLTVAKQAIFVILLFAIITSRKRFRWAFYGLIAGAGFLASITLIQAVFGLQTMEFAGFGHVRSAEIANAIDSWRYVGPVDDPNYYAQLLLLALPPAILGAMAATAPSQRLAFFGAAGVVLSALILTVSRGAIVALLITLFIALWRQPKRLISTAVLIAMFAGLALLLVPTVFVDRFVGAYHDLMAAVRGTGYVADKAIAGRLAEMQVALRLFIDHPLLGVGYGNYDILYQDTARLNGLMSRGEGREAHNLFLEILAERGLLGFAVFSGLIGSAIWLANRGAVIMRLAGHQLESAFWYATTLSIIAYLATSLFLHEAFTTSFWAIIALASASLQFHSEDPFMRLQAGRRNETSPKFGFSSQTAARRYTKENPKGADNLNPVRAGPVGFGTKRNLDMMTILRRNIALIVGVSLIAAGVGPYLAMVSPSNFVAKASLVFRFEKEYAPQNIASTQYRGEPIRTSIDEAIQTEMEILGSREVVERAVIASGYLPMRDMRQERLPAFLEALSLQRVEGTQVVRVSFTDVDPKMAEISIGALFDSYFAVRASLFDTDPREVLRDQAEEARTELTRLRTLLDITQRGAGIEQDMVSVPSLSTHSLGTMINPVQFYDEKAAATPQVQLADLETEIRLAEDRYESLKALLNEHELSARIDQVQGPAIKVLDAPGANPNPTGLSLAMIGLLSAILGSILASLAVVGVVQSRAMRGLRSNWLWN